MSLTQSLLPVVALMAARAVSATAGKGESNSENSVEKCPVSIQRFGSCVSSVADPGCLFRIADPNFHPGSKFFPSRIRLKEFKYFNPKIVFKHSEI
jgi:hypothetical protein